MGASPRGGAWHEGGHGMTYIDKTPKSSAVKQRYGNAIDTSLFRDTGVLTDEIEVCGPAIALPHIGRPPQDERLGCHMCSKLRCHET